MIFVGHVIQKGFTTLSKILSAIAERAAFKNSLKPNCLYIALYETLDPMFASK